MRKEEVENLIEAAINYQAMENYKVSAMTIARAYKSLQRHKVAEKTLLPEVIQTIEAMVRTVAEADVS